MILIYLKGSPGTLVELRTCLLVPSTDHGTHRKTHASIICHHISQQFRGSRYRNPFLVPQLVNPEGNFAKFI